MSYVINNKQLCMRHCALPQQITTIPMNNIIDNSLNKALCVVNMFEQVPA